MLASCHETTFVSRQRLGKHVPAATDTHATIEVLLETVFSTRSVRRGYKEETVSPESVLLESVKKRDRRKDAVGRESPFRCALSLEAEDKPSLEAVTRPILVKTLRAGKDLACAVVNCRACKSAMAL
jgi:hypothetical protein